MYYNHNRTNDMDSQKPFILVALSDEEAKGVLEAFENFKGAHGVDLNARPFISDNGTIGCEVRFFKKQELTPKVEKFQQEENGKETTETN